MKQQEYIKNMPSLYPSVPHTVQMRLEIDEKMPDHEQQRRIVQNKPRSIVESNKN